MIEFRITLNSLQDFAQSDIGQSKGLLAKLSIKPLGMRIRYSPKVIDPDSRIHNCHGARLASHAALTGFLQISVPLHLAAKPADASPRMGSYQQPQRCLYYRLFRVDPCATHSLLHQLIIDFNICSQRDLRCVENAGLCVLSLARLARIPRAPKTQLPTFIYERTCPCMDNSHG